ncbi:hypothetical protein Tco_0614838 [Tanacetum coccineum]
MDPNKSIGRLCLGEDNCISLNDGVESNEEWDAPKYNDTADSGAKKEAKVFTFYRMETEEISERYVAPCFVNGLEAYDGEINLDNDKNMISNELAVKLCLEYEVKNGDMGVKKELIVALRGEIYFVKFIINLEDDDIELGVVFGRSFLRRKSSINKKRSCKNYKMKCDDEGPSLTVNRALNHEELLREELEKDLWERIVILNEPRPIIEKIKYGENTRKYWTLSCWINSKLDGELELEEVGNTRHYLNDPGAFVLPIRLEGRFDTHALAIIGSNINIIPYRIFEKLGTEQDVLCQVGITMVLAKFLVLDMPVDRTVPIVVGRSFLHTYGGIINTLKGTTSAFDGVYHQKFFVEEIQNDGEESDNDDEEEYYLKRDETGRPFYGSNLMSYFDRNDPMERALAIQDSINPFWKKKLWKKAVAFLGSLSAPLLHTEWVPKGSRDFVKEIGDRNTSTKTLTTWSKFFKTSAAAKSSTSSTNL